MSLANDLSIRIREIIRNVRDISHILELTSYVGAPALKGVASSGYRLMASRFRLPTSDF